MSSNQYLNIALCGTPDRVRPIKHHELQILIVEDNLVNQRLYAKLLKKFGCIVYIASNGVETLDFLPNTTFWHERCGDDHGIAILAILVDISVPVMDGFSCTRHIREMQQECKITTHVPYLLLSFQGACLRRIRIR